MRPSKGETRVIGKKFVRQGTIAIRKKMMKETKSLTVDENDDDIELATSSNECDNDNGYNNKNNNIYERKKASISWWRHPCKKYNQCWHEWKFVYRSMVMPFGADAEKRCLGKCLSECIYLIITLIFIIIALIVMTLVSFLLFSLCAVQISVMMGLVSGCAWSAQPMQCAIDVTWDTFSMNKCHTQINETHFAVANWTMISSNSLFVSPNNNLPRQRQFDEHSFVTTRRVCITHIFVTSGGTAFLVNVIVFILVIFVLTTVTSCMDTIPQFWGQIQAHRARWRSLNE